jgi:hypothetical protein
MKSLCLSILTLFLSFSLGIVLSKAQAVSDPEDVVIKKVADNILSETIYECGISVKDGQMDRREEIF